MMNNIYLIGDAILDNYYYLTNRNNDLTKELTIIGYNVNNYACDDIRITDILNGYIPNTFYMEGRDYKYPLNKEGKLIPLKLLSNNPFESVYNFKPITNTNNKTVVLSMGGDDIQANIKNILLGPTYFINSIINPKFVSDYSQVIENVLIHCNKIILVSIYLPYLGPGSKYFLFSSYSKDMLDKWNNFITSIGKKYNIPILDLSKMLDPNNRKHYSEKNDSRISDLTNRCIAKCIDHIVKNYDGFKIFYTKNLNYNKIYQL